MSNTGLPSDPTTVEGWIALIDESVEEYVADQGVDHDEIYPDMVAAQLGMCADPRMAREVCRRTLGYTPVDLIRMLGPEAEQRS